MDLLLTVGLPLALAFIMFSLGVGLTLADFRRVALQPRGFFIGALAQLVLLPIVAFALLHVLPLSGALAVGVMILSFCPGGVTSNILTRIAGGNVALSITLTAVISLTTALTLPVLLALSAKYFDGAAAPDINVTRVAISMFVITVVPVALGLAFRGLATSAAERVEHFLFRLAGGLFVVIVLAALAANWAIFVENILILGPVLILLNLIMFGLGITLARFAGLDQADSLAIAVEAGVQNSTLGITVATLVTGAALGAYALPSGVYGITMYLVTIPIILLLRRRG